MGNFADVPARTTAIAIADWENEGGAPGLAGKRRNNRPDSAPALVGDVSTVAHHQTLVHETPVGCFLMIPGQFVGIDDRRTLAHAIVDTIREPLLVLDKDLRVVAISRSFYQTFRVSRQDVQGRPVYALGDGQWDIPELRVLLEEILPRHTVMEAYEVEHDFAGIGRRTMLLNARAVLDQSDEHALNSFGDR